MTSPPRCCSVDAAATIADAAGVPAPVTIADKTTADELGAIGFETAVTIAADLATIGVRTRLVPTNRLADLRERVAQARIAVGAVRAAYDTGNAASIKAAVKSARCVLLRVQTLAQGQADQPCPA